MSRIELLLKKLPGSTATKAFITSSVLCLALGYPIFSKTDDTVRQGHDYLSSEKPEAIRANQEKLRREYRKKRNNQQEKEQE